MLLFLVIKYRDLEVIEGYLDFLGALK